MVGSVLRMADGISATSTAGIGSIVAVRGARDDATGIVMPVRPAQAIFASFRHIQVLPDSRLQDGVPLYKLRILDALMDRAAAGTQTGSSAAAASGGSRAGWDGLGGPSPSRTESSVDALIVDLSQKLRATDGRAGAQSPAGYRAGFLPLPGAFVDLVA